MSQSSRKAWVRLPATSTVVAAALTVLAVNAAHLGAQPATPRYDVASSPSRTGYEGPLVLRLPASARFLGMANAGITANDGDAIFYSPGMLTQARGVSLSMQRYGSNATAGSMGSVQTLGAFAIGVGVQVLQFGTDAIDPVSANEAGAPALSDGGAEQSSSTAITFGVGRAVKGYRVGAAVKYGEERLGASRDGVLALDVGVSRALGRATLALSVQNLGSGPELSAVSGSLPTRVTIGYGGGPFALWEHWDLGMQSQVSVERDGFVRPAGGVELGYVPIEGVSLMLRGGVRLPREKDEPLATGGLGLNVDRFSLDWSLEPMRGDRPIVHRVGVRIR